MPLTIRLDPETERLLDREVARRGGTRSEVVREALTRFLATEERAASRSFYDDAASVIGTVDTGGMGLSERTGERFRRLLEDRRAGRAR